MTKQIKKIIFLVGTANGGKSTTLNKLKNNKDQHIIQVGKCDIFVKNMSNCDECFDKYLSKINKILNNHNIILVSLCIDELNLKCNKDLNEVCEKINNIDAEKYFFVIKNGKNNSVDISKLDCFNKKNIDICDNSSIGCANELQDYLKRILSECDSINK